MVGQLLNLDQDVHSIESLIKMINVELVDNRPVTLQGERILLCRKDMSLEVLKSGLVPLKATGSLYLTSDRMVFVCNNTVISGGISFTSFGVALQTLSNEKFNQPLFGCNNLSGQTVEGIKFKFYFVAGGASVFLPSFRTALHNAKTLSTEEDSNAATEELLRRAKLLASSDPSDPSVVYMSVENE